MVYAIGFYPAKSYHTFKAYGPSGQKGNTKISLQEEWGDTPTSYLGITYPGYPNMFLMYGMGSNLGHNSVIHMIECQATYIVDAITQMIEKASSESISKRKCMINIKNGHKSACKIRRLVHQLVPHGTKIPRG